MFSSRLSRGKLGLLALAVEIKPPSQSPNPFKRGQAQPSPFIAWSNPPKPTPNPPQSYPQRLQNMVKPIPAVKARSKPPQSHPTFKTRSNPPHPPAPLLNRSNPPRVPDPRRTHPTCQYNCSFHVEGLSVGQSRLSVAVWKAPKIEEFAAPNLGPPNGPNFGVAVSPPPI